LSVSITDSTRWRSRHRERAGIHLSTVRKGMAEGFASFLKGSTSIDKLERICFLGETEAPADSR